MPSQQYRNASLEKGLSVLSEIASAASPAGVTSIANRTGLDYSTAYRLIATLEHLGYVRRTASGKLYEPGDALRQLGLVRPSMRRLIEAATPVMAELVEELGETVNLSHWEGERLVLVHIHEGTHMLTTRTSVGEEFPIHCSASGKVLLAWMEREERWRLLGDKPLEAMTEHSITDPVRLEEELEKARRLGYAVNRDEHVPGLSAAAAPVLSRSGRVEAMIDLSLPTARVAAGRSLERLARKLIDAAGRIATEAGLND